MPRRGSNVSENDRRWVEGAGTTFSDTRPAASLKRSANRPASERTIHEAKRVGIHAKHACQFAYRLLGNKRKGKVEGRAHPRVSPVL